MSPFEAVYGWQLLSLRDYVPGASLVAAVDDVLTVRATLVRQLRENLARAQLRMTQKANRHKTEVEYEVGDWVWLKLQPYRQITMRQHRSNKLARRYYAPFQIITRIGRVAYRLELPKESCIHNVFHVSLLKACKSAPPFHKVAWPDGM
ncbi:unnamed protein product [Rhodiola kirilowii]